MMRGWLALVFALSLVPADRITAPQPTLPQSPLTIETGGGSVRFTVELATTPVQQQRGLMFRRALAPNAGMLFVYDDERPRSFWMKNTLIPLDMVFVRADGTIGRIAENTVPMSLDPVPSIDPVSAVLEIRGGRAAELGLKEGDKVSWPR